MSESSFSHLSDDVILNIFLKLEDDPRNWARLACVSTKFSSLVRDICWKNKCFESFPSIVSDLLSATSLSDPTGGWASLYKLSVSCPGLLHAGVVLENSDFGLERELGPDENYRDLGSTCIARTKKIQRVGRDFSASKKKIRRCRSVQAHLASGVWNLSREQGNKLLARRFREDCLYICDWPGCVHTEEKRNYMIFRGIFKNFKRSRVWRMIKDEIRSKISLDCAFCPCKETWDLHFSLGLRRVFGFHDDGEPVVRAYVCENGHVSGAWTDRPMYA